MYSSYMYAVGGIVCKIPDDIESSQPVMLCLPDDHNDRCPDIEVSLRCTCDGKFPTPDPTRRQPSGSTKPVPVILNRSRPTHPAPSSEYKPHVMFCLGVYC